MSWTLEKYMTHWHSSYLVGCGTTLASCTLHSQCPTSFSLVSFWDSLSHWWITDRAQMFKCRLFDLVTTVLMVWKDININWSSESHPKVVHVLSHTFFGMPVILKSKCILGPALVHQKSELFCLICGIRMFAAEQWRFLNIIQAQWVLSIVVDIGASWEFISCLF